MKRISLNGGFYGVDRRSSQQGVYGWERYLFQPAGLLFDTIGITSSLVMAFDNRRLWSQYLGGINRIRESSGNTLAVIGADGQDLSNSSLVAHVGGNSGFYETLYDQSNNGRNLTMTNNANQPRIRNAGTTDIINSHPVMRGIRASATRIETGTITPFLTGNTMTLIMLCSVGTQSSYDFARYVSAPVSGGIDNQDGGFNITNANLPNTIAYVGGNNQYLYPNNSTGNVSGNVVVSIVRSGTTVTIRINNAMATSGNFPSTNYNINRLCLLSSYGGGNHIDHSIGPFYLFSTALSDANRIAVEKNIGDYYGIAIPN